MHNRNWLKEKIYEARNFIQIETPEIKGRMYDYTVSDNTLPFKEIEQYFNSVCELEVLNDTRIFCYRSSSREIEV